MLGAMSFASGAGPRPPTASRALLTAALGGLMCLGVTACTNSSGAGITSSKVVTDMTQQKFTQMCDDRGGTVEVIPECAGKNSCKGMAYDTATQTLTEHTCKGTNTCAGYNCVIPS